MALFQLQCGEGEPGLLVLESWEREFSGVSAGFTTRLGGVSEDGCATLNCALHVTDDAGRVVENRRRIAAALGAQFDAWTCGEQVHGDRVAVVRRDEMGRGRLSAADAIEQADALITNEPGIWLTSFYADCVPLYFVDPVHRAVGLAHAGWRGTVAQIARKTVEAMGKAYGTKAEDVRTAIGPSIESCCYEVDDRVVSAVDDCLRAIGANVQEKSMAYHTAAEPGKFKLGLQEVNRQIMIKAGIVPTHIELCGICTGCRTDLFFSHRAERGNTGRMASWIGLDLRRK